MAQKEYEKVRHHLPLSNFIELKEAQRKPFIQWMGDPAKPPAGTSASQKGLVHNAFSPWSAISEKEIPRMMYEASSVCRMVTDGTYPNDGERIKPVEAPYPEDDEKDNLCEDLKLKPGDR